MITANEAAVQCKALYTGQEYFTQVLTIRRICLGIVKRPDCVIFNFRGSLTLLDWARDLLSELPFPTRPIGVVPAGFYDGIVDVFKATGPITIGLPIVLVGHSLGAAHAALFGGEILAAGGKIAKAFLFGCPNPGDMKLQYIWSGTDVESYKNLSDPVTTVPIIPDIRALREFIPLSIEPKAGAEFYGTVFADHCIDNYIEGTKNAQN